MVMCGICKRKLVPEILLSTTLPFPSMGISGKGIFIQARACRQRKKQDGEVGAIALSEAIPFLEYDVHKQLISKLRVLQMNAIFGLKFTVEIGPCLMVAVATGTAYSLHSLPTPFPICFESLERKGSVLTSAAA
eukprot:TRINITY_DN6120_c0_g1_i1.p2 TRINITY_DN6120_c0_g1~~TRINITY_DN6120_c0_g1_i1.p2  ORF type:complete len:134 (+),score=23.54 TRINITY_DN6120_c0_g1_i1:143-544(+)